MEPLRPLSPRFNKLINESPTLLLSQILSPKPQILLPSYVSKNLPRLSPINESSSQSLSSQNSSSQNSSFYRSAASATPSRVSRSVMIPDFSTIKSPYHQINLDNFLMIDDITKRIELIKILSDNDFIIDNDNLRLIYDQEIIVLFHLEDMQSYSLVKTFASVAQNIAGPVFATVNLSHNSKVATLLNKLDKPAPIMLFFANKRGINWYNKSGSEESLINFVFNTLQNIT